MTPFVVVSHGRSGSTVLVRAIDQHPLVRCYAEVFNAAVSGRVLADTRKYVDGEDPATFCRDEIYVDERDVSAIGFKLHVNQMKKSELERRIWAFLQSKLDLHIILLNRENLFDCYVSDLRARQSGHWRRLPGEPTPESYLSPLTIDIRHCHTYLSNRAKWIKLARDRFSKHPNLEIAYNGLVSDFQATLDRVFAFLHVEPYPVNAPLGRMNCVAHGDGITNFFELKVHFRDTEFGRFFD